MDEIHCPVYGWELFLFLLGFCGGQVGDNVVRKLCTAAFQVLREGGCVEQIYAKGHVLPPKK